jgi:hypothetical protein
MIKTLKTILEYIGIGSVLLGAIIVYGTLRADGFNGYILATGVLLIAVPITIFIIIERLTDRKRPDVKHLRNLKLTGIKILVDLTKCKVKSNSWTTEIEKYDNPRILFLNEVSGHSDKNIERIESNISRVEYTCDFNGKRRTFLSSAIAKDNITLKILLEIQKETVIYIDRYNSRYYYFDLDFINK